MEELEKVMVMVVVVIGGSDNGEGSSVDGEGW